MTLYRAVPLASLGRPQDEVAVSADSAVEALERAKLALGEGTAFDLCEGKKIVLSHLPERRWGRVKADDEPR